MLASGPRLLPPSSSAAIADLLPSDASRHARRSRFAPARLPAGPLPITFHNPRTAFFPVSGNPFRGPKSAFAVAFLPRTRTAPELSHVTTIPSILYPLYGHGAA